MTHQGPGKELSACPGKEAAGEVLRRCEGLLEGTVGVEGGKVLCGHKMKKTTFKFNLDFTGFFKMSVAYSGGGVYV